jgi:N-6 DNA Methylase
MIVGLDKQKKNQLLEQAYQTLDYNKGVLLDAVLTPPLNSKEAEEWLDKGEWLTLATKIQAEKILFLNNDPIIIFCQKSEVLSEEQLFNLLRQAWCMSRPKFLFLALPNELLVYSLDQLGNEKISNSERIKPLQKVERVVDVLEKLMEFRREEIETGQLFEGNRFGNSNDRVDKRLINDLKRVRDSLLNLAIDGKKLESKIVHSILGRSIFIRYLEDRGILTLKYFEDLAENKEYWQALLKNKNEKPSFSPSGKPHWFDLVLQDKDFTYALFEKLSQDFNGDMFPDVEIEKKEVQQPHLALLRKFLLGDTDAGQPTLFFWEYDFEIIPIELISSIYEEFYHKGTVDDKATHYTPSVLVEYVVAEVLTKSVLETNPKILDPACGSGIFLVEAFRRVARYTLQKRFEELNGEEISPKQIREDLKKILSNQIYGVEINQEAARITAFSLYLAYLNYQEPKDILVNKRLPKLLYQANIAKNENYYQTIVNENFFCLLEGEKVILEDKLNLNKKFKGRKTAEKLLACENLLPFSMNFFNVIIGNPPWGDINKKSSEEMKEVKEQVESWCSTFNWFVGNRELSQAFIGRSLTLLQKEGVCGLLLPIGVFLKRSSNSLLFRTNWLENCTLQKIVNFTHVRNVYFSASAPFAFVYYKFIKPTFDHWFEYWSAKKTILAQNTKLVRLSYNDLHQVNQYEVLEKDYLWKVYWWGSHRDANLITTLSLNKTLQNIITEKKLPKPGRGFQGVQPNGKIVSSLWLKDYKQLPNTLFKRYGHISTSMLVSPPEQVHFRGIEHVYHGIRLLVSRGIKQEGEKKGQIIARLEDLTFCFTNAFHGIRLDKLEDWERKIIIGILWSSLARYYFFMTANNWGVWHYELYLVELLTLPVRFPNNEQLKNQIINIVERLQQFNINELNISESYFDIDELEKELDKNVFKLYNLSESQQDLILDMCETGIENFYKSLTTELTEPVEYFPKATIGTVADLPKLREEEKGLEGYLYAFLKMWNYELEPIGEFYWRVVRPNRLPIIAILFTTQEKGSTPIDFISSEEEWESMLKKCTQYLLQTENNPEKYLTQKIFVEGIIRIVSNTEIIIIKSDEKRLWTRSTAREDAEATKLKATFLQEEEILLKS